MGALDPKVGEALINDNSVLEIMQHPKMSEALQALKKDPNQYHSLIKDDPELEALFQSLRGLMGNKEEEMKSEISSSFSHSAASSSDGSAGALAVLSIARLGSARRPPRRCVPAALSRCGGFRGPVRNQPRPFTGPGTCGSFYGGVAGYGERALARSAIGRLRGPRVDPAPAALALPDDDAEALRTAALLDECDGVPARAAERARSHADPPESAGLDFGTRGGRGCPV